MLAAGGLMTGVAVAQEKKVVKEVVEDVVIFNAQPGGAMAGQHMVASSFFAGRMNVKGAPYAAESVNETTQVLSDGTRITNKSTSKMYRDSEGRTRMEASFAPVGNWVPGGESGGIVTITDPVAGDHIALKTGDKTAMRTKLPNIKVTTTGPGHMESREVHVEMRSEAKSTSSATATVTTAPKAGGNVMFFRSGPEGLPMRMPLHGTDVKAEQLGKQTIEGVQCDGVRETMTIAAGKIGNDRPIVVTTERWTSPELGIEILRKHSDPRSGEIVYRVTMLQRGEQPRSLFEVPADYKLQEAPQVMKFDRRVEPKDNI
jgi:hypothetical protein